MAPENGSSRRVGEKQPALCARYPANTSWEISLSTGETVTGTVYCTDEVSNTVFLQKHLTHTTLATELRVVHASQISRSKHLVDNKESGDESSSLLGDLPKVQKKALEEREKRAIRMAEDSFRHINEKVRAIRMNLMAKLHWLFRRPKIRRSSSRPLTIWNSLCTSAGFTRGAGCFRSFTEGLQ